MGYGSPVSGPAPTLDVGPHSDIWSSGLQALWVFDILSIAAESFVLYAPRDNICSLNVMRSSSVVAYKPLLPEEALVTEVAHGIVLPGGLQ